MTESQHEFVCNAVREAYNCPSGHMVSFVVPVKSGDNDENACVICCESDIALNPGQYYKWEELAKNNAQLNCMFSIVCSTSAQAELLAENFSRVAQALKKKEGVAK